MKNSKISKALGDIDQQFIQEAMTKKRRPWVKWVAAAACLCMVAVGALALWDSLRGGYQYQASVPNSYYVPRWEDSILTERYGELKYDGRTYRGREAIDQSLLGQAVGSGRAEGYDVYTETTYRESLALYEITGLSPEVAVAAAGEEGYYVYLYIPDEGPATLGELMDAYALADSVQLRRFSEREGSSTDDYYAISDDSFIWDVLQACREAPLQNAGSTFWSDREYLSFTVTSEVLGCYKKVLYISADGYFFTNMMEYGYLYDIGQEAAGQIIAYARENAEKAEFEPYEQTIAGTLVEIGENYVLIDDTVLCRKASDGQVYKVYLDDIRARRCVEREHVKQGDVVVVTYRGTMEENEIFGARDISKGYLDGNLVAVPE